MAAGTDPSEDQAQRLQQAAAWHVRLGDEAEPSAEFAAWLADPRNRAAFDAVCDGWNAFTDQNASIALLKLRQDALSSASQRAVGGARWLTLPMRTAAALILLVSCLGAWLWVHQGKETYVAALGERRVLTLSDGSRVSLDSNTRLVVRYTGHKRSLWLERGQAFFDVAKDVRRPFVVAVGGRAVAAVGTSFNIEQLGDKTLVTLIEGRVTVSERRNQQVVEPISLSPGNLLIIESGREPIILPADRTNATAWQSGMLIFNDDTLSDAVARVNRYTDRPIGIDERIGQMRVSGAFRAGDIDAFVEAVTMYLPIETSVGMDGRSILTPMD